VAARWLLRCLEIRNRATIDDAALVTSCLVALGGDRHLEAATALRAIANTANFRALKDGRTGASSEPSPPQQQTARPAPSTIDRWRRRRKPLGVSPNQER